MSLSTIPSVGVGSQLYLSNQLSSEYCYYLSIVVEEFAGLVQDKSSVEDFVLWIENILERCIRKVRSCFTPTYISKHGSLPTKSLEKVLAANKGGCSLIPRSPFNTPRGWSGNETKVDRQTLVIYCCPSSLYGALLYGVQVPSIIEPHPTLYVY